MLKKWINRHKSYTFSFLMYIFFIHKIVHIVIFSFDEGCYFLLKYEKLYVFVDKLCIIIPWLGRSSNRYSYGVCDILMEPHLSVLSYFQSIAPLKQFIETQCNSLVINGIVQLLFIFCLFKCFQTLLFLLYFHCMRR